MSEKHVQRHQSRRKASINADRSQHTRKSQLVGRKRDCVGSDDDDCSESDAYQSSTNSELSENEESDQDLEVEEEEEEDKEDLSEIDSLTGFGDGLDEDDEDSLEESEPGVYIESDEEAESEIESGSEAEEGDFDLQTDVDHRNSAHNNDESEDGELSEMEEFEHEEDDDESDGSDEGKRNGRRSSKPAMSVALKKRGRKKKQASVSIPLRAEKNDFMRNHQLQKQRANKEELEEIKRRIEESASVVGTQVYNSVFSETLPLEECLLRARSMVIDAESGLSVDDDHTTPNVLFEFEIAKILILRQSQLDEGAASFIPDHPFPYPIPNHYVAQYELRNKLLPFVLQRTLGETKTEYFLVSEMQILFELDIDFMDFHSMLGNF